MVLKQTTLVFLALPFTVAFADTAHVTSRNLTTLANSHTQPQMTWIDYKDIEFVSFYNQFGQNGGSLLGTFDVAQFSIPSAISTIKSEKSGCADREIHSENNAVLDSFSKFVQEVDPFWSENDKNYAVEKTKGVLEDYANNLAIISSTYKADGLDAPESCMFWHFYVFRKNGTVMKLVVDQTD